MESRLRRMVPPTAKGRLEAVLFADYELSEPFELGEEGTFSPEKDGKLFLRCVTRGRKLGDNKGEISV